MTPVERFYWFLFDGALSVSVDVDRIYERTDDPRFLNVAVKAVEFVLRRQRWAPGRTSVHGAIAGSTPLFGPYLALRYPNWAAKFFVDAARCANALQALSNQRHVFDVRAA
jgi:hypothetical protein